MKTQIPLVPVWFEPPNQTEEPKASFQLRGLTGIERLELFDENANGRHRLMLRYGVIGFKNLMDHTGNPYPPHTQIATILERLDFQVLIDVENEIARLTYLGDEAKKN